MSSLGERRGGGRRGRSQTGRGWIPALPLPDCGPRISLRLSSVTQEVGPMGPLQRVGRPPILMALLDGSVHENGQRVLGPELHWTPCLPQTCWEAGLFLTHLKTPRPPTLEQCQCPSLAPLPPHQAACSDRSLSLSRPVSSSASDGLRVGIFQF